MVARNDVDMCYNLPSNKMFFTSTPHFPLLFLLFIFASVSSIRAASSLFLGYRPSLVGRWILQLARRHPASIQSLRSPSLLSFPSYLSGQSIQAASLLCTMTDEMCLFLVRAGPPQLGHPLQPRVQYPLSSHLRLRPRAVCPHRPRYQVLPR